MTEPLNVKKIALSTGFLFAILHLAVVITIISGALKMWLSFHFISLNYTVQPVQFGLLISGILIAFTIGAVSGGIFASAYNKIP